MSKQLYLEAIEALRQRVEAGDVSAPYGVMLIAQERHRQVAVEVWTPEHDDQHTNEQLASAAAFYALPEKYGELLAFWPWDPEWNKKRKHDRIRQLTIAGALIAAELDRLRRLELEAERRRTLTMGDGYTPDPYDFDEERAERDEEWHNREIVCETCGGVKGPEYSTCFCDDDDPDRADEYGDEEDERWELADRDWDERKLAELERMRDEIDEEEEEWVSDDDA